ncbi:ATP-binding cassette domain-containing protein [Marinomonas mediterranea]|uniref:Fe(3+)-transporting ATPase n=1 Tax=Marinomonas mediterranea (strain ATCC 700492 / JCM 21426 / NBRC 103028 / MMB-1) TaxID=717774 RepID=F2K259_MARM1|nr:ATP-binding cassette domain-containing protein [Marinomonas mediterranea]ADZ91137.1 Fe(3+)-transporting ATPase [Marinomonas mediterranea MMB-1]WCN13192.1 ATP-binding cassette domain-containing protein [Marinomonas mediterranea]WCN17268.1 ATP-binding cassette domain-containing protein [Marinomonas mediterranea MMB-1]
MLVVRNFSLQAGERQLIDDLSFEVNEGDILTIMGASGIGKSSLLSYISGTTPPALKANGTLLLNDIELVSKPPHKRDVGLMQQSPLLFPHMTIAENLLFAVPSHYSTKSRKQKVMDAINDLELQGHEEALPNTLSGGQQARAALLRTLLSEPKCLLIDEPFSKLDATLRATTRTFVKEKVKHAGIPAILVTHDPEDAESMGGAIIHLSHPG